jgi:hypothetical protein
MVSSHRKNHICIWFPTGNSFVSQEPTLALVECSVVSTFDARLDGAVFASPYGGLLPLQTVVAHFTESWSRYQVTELRNGAPGYDWKRHAEVNPGGTPFAQAANDAPHADVIDNSLNESAVTGSADEAESARKLLNFRKGGPIE